MTPRQYPPDELTPEQRENMCPSCRMRYKYPLPAVRELFGPLYIDRKAYRWLENAARLFDQQSGDDTWSAADFIGWVRNDIFGERPPMVEHDGAPGTKDNRHPFTLPQAGRLTR